ncbi:ribonuclease E inhibitor RraB, partial [Klebsiella michiganensis]|uniref:ribonuclease E inhibitor RraB n=1 Tax=Klebsiella michiganensis TaxID=1134687 RepID=UPI00396A2AD9
AVEAFKLGYEVTEPEELEVEEGDTVICCDILSESALNAELIDVPVKLIPFGEAAEMVADLIANLVVIDPWFQDPFAAANAYRQ